MSAYAERPEQQVLRIPVRPQETVWYEGRERMVEALYAAPDAAGRYVWRLRLRGVDGLCEWKPEMRSEG